MRPSSILTLVLNLKHRADRRNAIQERLTRMGLVPVFIEAVNGWAPELSDTVQPIVSRTGLNPGEVGCYLSHIKAWQYVQASGHDDALVLEDDSLLDPTLPEILTALQKHAETLHVVRLSASCKLVGNRVCQLTPESTLICTTKNPASTIGYYLTKAGAGMLLDNLSGIHRAIDKEFDQYWRWGGQVLSLKPSVVYHDGSTESDIGALTDRAPRVQSSHLLGKARQSLNKRAVAGYMAVTHPLRRKLSRIEVATPASLIPHRFSDFATKPVNKKKQVILFLTHQWNAGVADRYRQLQSSVSDLFDVRILLDATQPHVKAQCFDSLGPTAYAEQVVPFTTDSVVRYMGIPLFRRGRIVPGSAYFPVLAFSMDTSYEYYWVVEYDVLIQCGWRDFLGMFDGCSADLVCTHLSTKSQSPDWTWWKRFDVPRKYAAYVRQNEGDIPKAFFPLYRASRRALTQSIAAHRAGLKAHFELALPMALWLEGMRIQDMAEIAPLYTAGSLGGSNAVAPYSSFRWRPAITPEELSGGVQSVIYHPVKDVSTSAAS